MIKRAGLVIPVLVLSVISQGFGDKAAPGDGVTSIAEPETFARGRLAAGLLLGAAAHARWR